MATTTETLTKNANNMGIALGNSMKEIGPQVEKKVEQATYETGKQIGKALNAVSDRAADYYSTSRDYVKENPVKGVAIAAAVGVTAGCLLTMALGRKH